MTAVPTGPRFSSGLGSRQIPLFASRQWPQQSVRVLDGSGRRPRTSRTPAPRRALPFDVLHSILARLPQTNLRTAAAASRRFRETAKEAGLYIHRRIAWASKIDVDSEVDILLAVIQRAQADDCRISLEVSYVGPLPWGRLELDKFGADTRSTFAFLANCISRAMDKLVFLHVSIPRCYRPAMDAVLVQPAPYLRLFDIRDYAGYGSLRDEPLVPLPTDLFAGHAPQLQTVSLKSAALGPIPIAAFSRVERLRIQYEEIFPDGDVAAHFPRLRSLDVAYLNECSPAVPPKCILRGLDLSTLTVEVREHEECVLAVLADELDLPAISEIRCDSSAGMYGTIWAAPLRADADTELAARIAVHEDLVYTVVIDVRARGSDWRCVYTISGWDIQEPHPFFGENADLASLRLDNTYLPGLIESNISLPRLRDLRIDLRPHGQYATMIWPAAWGLTLSPDDGGDPQGGYSVPCPALETLAIVALEQPMRVRETEVAQLSEALGQRRRKGGARAQLVLRDVSFVSVGLDQMFSTVRSEACLSN